MLIVVLLRGKNQKRGMVVLRLKRRDKGKEGFWEEGDRRGSSQIGATQTQTRLGVPHTVQAA